MVRGLRQGGIQGVPCKHEREQGPRRRHLLLGVLISLQQGTGRLPPGWRGAPNQRGFQVWGAAGSIRSEMELMQ